MKASSSILIRSAISSYFGELKVWVHCACCALTANAVRVTSASNNFTDLVQNAMGFIKFKLPTSLLTTFGKKARMAQALRF